MIRKPEFDSIQPYLDKYGSMGEHKYYKDRELTKGDLKNKMLDLLEYREFKIKAFKLTNKEIYVLTGKTWAQLKDQKLAVEFCYVPIKPSGRV